MEARKRFSALLFALGCMLVIQLARFGLKSLAFLFVERTNFSDRVASLCAMALLSLAILAISRARGLPLSVFPARFSPPYVAAAALFAALLIATPIITRDTGFASIVLMVYSAVVTPIFEELIFRGLIWNRLKTAFHSEWAVYALTAVLFAVWHLGYVDALMLRVKSGLGNAMLWKAVTGLFFGAVLGLLRVKTKNCFSTMLLHGAMNLFGR